LEAWWFSVRLLAAESAKETADARGICQVLSQSIADKKMILTINGL
jgi:hypothetical protein